MPIGFFHNTFSVGQVQKVYKTDIRFNIIKRRETVIYKTISDIDNINLSYVVNKELTSDNSLSIFDKSSEFIPNRLPKVINEIVFSGKTYVSQVDRFLLTDQFLIGNSGQKVPLYYKHILNNFDATNINLSVSAIEILDKNFVDMPLLAIYIDQKIGAIYNNLINTFDSESGDYVVYYVKYSVLNSLDNTTTSYFEILNNETTFRQATFNDLNLNGTLKTGLKIYTMEQIESNLFEITLPYSAIYSLQEHPNSRIKLIKPTTTTIANPWSVSISNGNLITTLATSPTTSNLFKYSIPEYATQLFDPFIPYKKADKEISSRISSSLIKVLKNNIFESADDNLYILIKIRDINNKIKFVISDDPSIIGTSLDETIVINTIRSVDKLSGIVDILSPILDTDSIEVTYFYEEKEYEVFDIDFNPIFNTDIIGKKIVFYITPTTTGRTKAIFYLIVDHKDIVLFTSQNDDSFLNADIALNNFHYSAISSSSLNFINKYTVQASKDLQFANPANPKYLILGECITASPAAPEQSVLFDIRKPGGGLKDQPDLLEELVETVPEIQWITDDGFIDGLPYPGTAAFICEIPTYLQNEFGGNFTDIAIRQIIERHMVAGGYPITRGYSTDILFSVEPMIDGSLNISFLLKWRTYGNKKYNIYYSAFKEHDFEKSNSTPIIDNSAGNTYTITGTFVPNKVYWFYIVETDGVLDLPQSIIGPTDKLTYQNLNKVGIKTYLNPI